MTGSSTYPAGFRERAVGESLYPQGWEVGLEQWTKQDVDPKQASTEISTVTGKAVSIFYPY